MSILAWSFFVLFDEDFPTLCPQIEHIRDECLWTKPLTKRWKDKGLEGARPYIFLPPSDPEELTPLVLLQSDFPIDHAVSEIHNFVKVLPEGVTLDAFMRGQPPPLDGTVGNLAEVQNQFSTLAHWLGITPSIEERKLVCRHCRKGMTKEYLVWHMNAKCVAPIPYSLLSW